MQRLKLAPTREALLKLQPALFALTHKIVAREQRTLREYKRFLSKIQQIHTVILM